MNLLKIYNDESAAIKFVEKYIIANIKNAFKNAVIYYTGSSDFAKKINIDYKINVKSNKAGKKSIELIYELSGNKVKADGLMVWLTNEIIVKSERSEFIFYDSDKFIEPNGLRLYLYTDIDRFNFGISKLYPHFKYKININPLTGTWEEA